MGNTFEQGDRVRWRWGPGWGEGEVAERFTDRVTRELGGSETTRDADSQNPAYLIRQDDGDHVLKSHSELKKA